MSGEDNSVAPIERVNITYKSRAQGNQDVELPFKLLVAGEFSFKEDPTPLGERALIEINKDNFDDVMKDMHITIEADVTDELSGVPDAKIQARLPIESLRDLTPDRIVQRVPEMKRQLELANALQEVKSDLANPKKLALLRQKIEAVLKDENAKRKLEELKTLL